MSCDWSHDDCQFEGTEKCDTCFSESFHYKPAVVKKKHRLARHANKADGRGGSEFEHRNFKTNQSVLNTTTCKMTINSGATVLEKGDAWIRGMVNIMEEYKTKTVQKAKGKETFTIHKEWLDTLLSNFKEANKKGEDFEFSDLRFSFREADSDVYVIIRHEEFLSWIKTLNLDRLTAREAELKINLANRQKETVEAKLAESYARIAELEAQIELLEHKNKEII